MASSAGVSGGVAATVGSVSWLLAGSGNAGCSVGDQLFICVAAAAGLAAGSLAVLVTTAIDGLAIAGVAVTGDTCSVAALS